MTILVATIASQQMKICSNNNMLATITHHSLQEIFNIKSHMHFVINNGLKNYFDTINNANSIVTHTILLQILL